MAFTIFNHSSDGEGGGEKNIVIDKVKDDGIKKFLNEKVSLGSKFYSLKGRGSI